MNRDDYINIFENTACKQTYAMAEGVDAVVKAVIDHIHDEVIDSCDTAQECRQEIVNYSLLFHT